MSSTERPALRRRPSARRPGPRPRWRAAAILAALLALHCVGYDPGLELELALRAEPVPQAMETPEGGWLRLAAAEVRFDGAELVACADEGEAPLAALLAELGPERARAHGLEASGEAMVLTVDALHGTGAPVVAGTLRPLPGRYCALRVHLAEGLHLAGEREAPGDRAAPFDVASPEPRDVELPFDAPLALDRPEALRRTVVLDPRCWAAALPAEARPEDAAEVVAACLRVDSPPAP